MQKDKVKIISNVAASLILAALKLIDSLFISKIPNADVKAGLRLLLNPIRGMVQALSDENPRNAEQVAEIWTKWAGTDLVGFSGDKIQGLIARIENPQFQKPLSILVVPTLNMIQIFTDDDPNNAEQLKNNWLEFIASPDTHQVVLNDLLEPALSGVIQDEATLAIILSLIAEALEKGTGSLGKEKAEAIAKELRAKAQVKMAA